MDVRTLEDEVENFDRKIKELEARKTELNGKAEAAKRELDASETDLQNIEDRIRTAAQKLDPYREKLAQIDNEVDLTRSLTCFAAFLTNRTNGHIYDTMFAYVFFCLRFQVKVTVVYM